MTVWDWDVPNDIRYLDDIGASLFGYSRQAQFSEQEISSRIHPDDVAEWRRKVCRTIEAGGIYSHQYRIIRDNSVIWVRAKGNCILGRTGRPERFPDAIIDITTMRHPS